MAGEAARREERENVLCTVSTDHKASLCILSVASFSSLSLSLSFLFRPCIYHCFSLSLSWPVTDAERKSTREEESERVSERQRLSLLIFDPDEHKWQLEGARKVTLLPEGLPL